MSRYTAVINSRYELLLKPIELALNHALRFWFSRKPSTAPAFAKRSIRMIYRSYNSDWPGYDNQKIILDSAGMILPIWWSKPDIFCLVKSFFKTTKKAYSQSIQILGWWFSSPTQLTDWQQRFDFDVGNSNSAKITGEPFALGRLLQSIRRGLIGWMIKRGQELENSWAGVIYEKKSLISAG